MSIAVIFTFTFTFTFLCMLGSASAATIPSTTPDRGFFSTDGAINDLAERNGILYVGGIFTRVFIGDTSNVASSLVRTNLAAFDLNTRKFTSFSPNPDRSVVRLMAESDRLLVGGGFRTIAGQTHSGLAAVNLTSGAFIPFTPSFSNAATVICLHRAGNKLFAGGQFTRVGGLSRTNAVAFDAISGQVDTWDAGINTGLLNDIKSWNGELYLAGRFTQIQGRRQRGFAAFNLSTGSLLNWHPNLISASVGESLAIAGNTLCIGGQFTSALSESRINVALIDLTTKELLPACPTVGGSVSKVLIRDGTLFISGLFQSANTYSRTNLAAFDLTSGRLLEWEPNPVGEADTMLDSGSTLRVAGSMSSMGSLALGGYATFSGYTLPNELNLDPDSVLFFDGIGFQFAFTASQPGQVRIMGSSDLRVWSEVDRMNAVKGRNDYLDTQIPIDGRRWYRVEAVGK